MGNIYNIEVKNLRKVFKTGKTEFEAVKGISFNVKPGEILGLLGPNGAGKSTTINMLTGLLASDGGEIKIFGLDPEKNWEQVKNRMNVATAYEKLSGNLTVRQNLMIYAGIYGVKNRKEKIAKLSKMFGLENLMDRLSNKLSSGENTRLVLAKSLLNDPEVIFMDECTVGLDPDMAEKTRQIIKEYNEKTNCSIIFTSHYMYEVEELCDRIVFLKEGKVISIGTPDDIKKSMTNETIEFNVSKNRPKLFGILNSHKIRWTILEGNMIRFDIDTDKHNLQDILNAITNSDIEFGNLHIYKPTLDDFFIKIARTKKPAQNQEPNQTRDAS